MYQPGWPPPRPVSSGGGAKLVAVVALGVALGLAAAGPKASAVTPQALWAWLGGTRPPSPAGVAVTFALHQRGKPYRWGAGGPDAYDCSGLTWAAWRHAGVSIPRTAAAQLARLRRVTGPRKPGDLIVYRSAGPTRRHVAMVVAPGRMVEALGVGVPVRVVPIRGGALGAVRPG